MSRLKDRIAQEIAEWERLSGKKKIQVLLETADLSDVYTRRLIIIGGFVTDYFPELLSLTPQETEAENNIEFAPLIKFFNLLGSRQKILKLFIKRRSAANS